MERAQSASRCPTSGRMAAATNSMRMSGQARAKLAIAGITTWATASGKETRNGPAKRRSAPATVRSMSAMPAAICSTRANTSSPVGLMRKPPGLRLKSFTSN